MSTARTVPEALALTSPGDEDSHQEIKKDKVITSCCMYALLVFTFVTLVLHIVATYLYLNQMPWWQMIEPASIILSFNIISMVGLVVWVFMKVSIQSRTWPLILAGGNFVIISITMGCFYGFMHREVIYPHNDLTFLHLGTVSATSANLVLRDPNGGSATLSFRRVQDTDYMSSASQDLSESSDFVSTFRLSGLNTSTVYEVSYGNLDATFTTFPADGQPCSFRMHWGSCYMANFPWNTDQESWSYVSAVEPAYSIFLGDFIYADHPNFKGSELEDYRRHYRLSMSPPSFQTFASSVPMFSMIDDHEIFDNWQEGITGIYLNAIQVWNEYLGNANPQTYPELLYYHFNYGDTTSFVIDHRSYRENDVTPPSALGAQQKSDLFAWLLDAEANGFVWKFIYSPAPWTLNIEEIDAWQGYTEERNEILDFIHDNQVTNVLLFSGDRHYVYAVECLGNSSIFEFSSSPVGAFTDQSTEPFQYEIDETLFMDITHSNYFGGYVQYISTLDVDTTVSPPTVRVRSYLDKDVTNPMYDVTLTGAIESGPNNGGVSISSLEFANTQASIRAHKPGIRASVSAVSAVSSGADVDSTIHSNPANPRVVHKSDSLLATIARHYLPFHI